MKTETVLVRMDREFDGWADFDSADRDMHVGAIPRQRDGGFAVRSPLGGTMLAPRGKRSATLAARWAELREQLIDLGAQ